MNVSLLSLLSSVSLDENYDQSVWSLSSIGIFTVRTFYKHLTKEEPIENNFPFRQIWKVNTQPKVVLLLGKQVVNAF